MRILILTTRYFPHVGGVETVVEHLSAEWSKIHDVTIVTSKKSNGAFDIEDDLEKTNQINIKKIWMAVPRSWVGLIAFPIRFILSFSKLNKFIKEYSPDVLNVHFLDDITIYIWLLSIINKKLKFFVNIHGNDLHIFSKRFGYKFFIKSVLDNCEKIIVNSNYMRSELLDMYPYLDSKLMVIPNGLDINRIRKIEAKKYFDNDYMFFVGRFVYKKGIDILIRAFSMVNIPGLKLLIEGNGEIFKEMNDLVHTMNLQDKVAFTQGKLSNEEKISYMKGSVFGVMPSRIEPFGIVALEFMAAGVPLIASRTGGLEDILKNGSGVFFENENVKDLADKMTYLYQNRNIREKIIESQNMDIVHYTWHNISEEYIRSFLIR
jgi:glycosyltransferase involved in cell wall biosynthesis